MAKAIGGMAFIKADGEQFSTNGEFTLSIIESKASVVLATNGDVLYTEEPMASTVSGTLYFKEDFDAEKLVKMRDVTVTIELNNGKTAVISEAVQTGEASLDVAAGEFDFEFMGKGKWI